MFLIRVWAISANLTTTLALDDDAMHTAATLQKSHQTGCWRLIRGATMASPFSVVRITNTGHCVTRLRKRLSDSSSVSRNEFAPPSTANQPATVFSATQSSSHYPLMQDLPPGRHQHDLVPSGGSRSKDTCSPHRK